MGSAFHSASASRSFSLSGSVLRNFDSRLKTWELRPSTSNWRLSTSLQSTSSFSNSRCTASAAGMSEAGSTDCAAARPGEEAVRTAGMPGDDSVRAAGMPGVDIVRPPERGRREGSCAAWRVKSCSKVVRGGSPARPRRN
ncbi:hypothetical protein ACN28S_20705 [Cystobacter fuscus]